MEDQQDDNTIVLDLGDYGAASESYQISGIDTITLDSSWNTSSITIPSTTYTGSGGYTIGTGTSTVASWSAYNYDPSVNITSDGISIKEGGDIKVGNTSLSEFIEKVEERLAILKPNEGLEDRWEQLKELRRQYVELEKDLLEKEKIMKILKET